MTTLKRAFLEWKVYGLICIDTAVELMGEGYVIRKLENQWAKRRLDQTQM